MRNTAIFESARSYNLSGLLIVPLSYVLLRCFDTRDKLTSGPKSGMPSISVCNTGISQLRTGRAQSCREATVTVFPFLEEYNQFVNALT